MSSCRQQAGDRERINLDGRLPFLSSMFYGAKTVAVVVLSRDRRFFVKALIESRESRLVKLETEMQVPNTSAANQRTRREHSNQKDFRRG